MYINKFKNLSGNPECVCAVLIRKYTVFDPVTPMHNINNHYTELVSIRCDVLCGEPAVTRIKNGKFLSSELKPDIDDF
jgi:hypothetical protein